MEEQGPRTRALDAVTPRITRAWFVIATSDEVGHRPLRKKLWGTPVVLWRGDDGAPRALVDRCPHRSVPLSFGSCDGDTIRCGYHGWRFDGDGRVLEIPGLPGLADHPARHAKPVALREQQGLVWAWADPDTAPVGDPFHFRFADDSRYLTVRRVLPAPGSLHAVIENALDVPHTAFLHGGLFRTDSGRKPIRCVVRRFHDRVECEFVGESAPRGLAARLLSPSGGEVRHVDRFHLPSITEVEYHLGDENHLVLNGACTPVDDFETLVYAVVQVRSRIPRALLRRVVEPVALRIFQQDAEILALQTETLRTFGEASFVSTDIDVLGGHILRLMHRAARGEPGDPDAPVMVRETTMLV